MGGAVKPGLGAPPRASATLKLSTGTFPRSNNPLPVCKRVCASQGCPSLPNSPSGSVLGQLFPYRRYGTPPLPQVGGPSGRPRKIGYRNFKPEGQFGTERGSPSAQTRRRARRWPERPHHLVQACRLVADSLLDCYPEDVGIMWSTAQPALLLGRRLELS